MNDIYVEIVFAV